MESFYGGRKGISFTISKRFDGVNIPENTVRTGDFYATKDGVFLIEDGAPIVRTSENQDNLEYKWKRHEHDGSEVVDGSGVYFKEEWAQGMVQFFAKGAETTTEVGYGEYVIIDTIGNLHEYKNIENGLIYRRGMDYQQEIKDDIKEPGAGAKYIGQIVGPKGETPSIGMDTITNIKADENYNKINSGSTECDIISGKKSDAVECAWVEMRDAFGENVGVKIGFTFPYTVFNFSATRTSAYVEPKITRRTDRDNNKPFYYEFDVTIPEGIHGIDATNFRIDTTNAEQHKLVYDETDYTNETSVTTVKEIGDWKVIKDITLTDDGSLTVDYTSGDNSVFSEKIKWVKNIALANNGIITVTYNTEATEVLQNALTWIDDLSLSQNGNFKVIYNDNTEYTINLKWIENIEIKDDGTVIIKDNSGNIVHSHNKYLKTINDIQINTGSVEGEGNQKIKISYNTGENVEIGNPLNYIIESAVTNMDILNEKNINTTQPYHLLVRYADPLKRGNVSYPSADGTIKSDWKDLGYIRGEMGAVRVIGNFDTVDDLKDGNGNWKEPSEVEGYNPDRLGWGYTIEEKYFYLYDYNKKIWYNVGGFTANAKNIIVAAAAQSGASELQDGGFWFVIESNDSVE